MNPDDREMALKAFIIQTAHLKKSALILLEENKKPLAEFRKIISIADIRKRKTLQEATPDELNTLRQLMRKDLEEVDPETAKVLREKMNSKYPELKL